MITRRETLISEGKLLDNRIFIKKGAITWSDTSPIPVMHRDHVIGRANGIRREDDGRITASITFVHAVPEDVYHSRYNLFLTPVKFKRKKTGEVLVKQGEIQGIDLTYGPPVQEWGL